MVQYLWYYPNKDFGAINFKKFCESSLNSKYLITAVCKLPSHILSPNESCSVNPLFNNQSKIFSTPVLPPRHGACSAPRAAPCHLAPCPGVQKCPVSVGLSTPRAQAEYVLGGSDSPWKRNHKTMRSGRIQWAYTGVPWKLLENVCFQKKIHAHISIFFFFLYSKRELSVNSISMNFLKFPVCIKSIQSYG